MLNVKEYKNKNLFSGPVTLPQPVTTPTNGANPEEGGSVCDITNITRPRERCYRIW